MNNYSEKYNIKWRQSDRFERIGRFDLKGNPKDIFPLLCPVLEYEWLPDWKCTMCYSRSGVAEKDTIFHTKENLGKSVVWTCITYEPDSFIEYLMVSGKDAVIRLSILLEKKSGKKTAVTWKMLFTLTSGLSKQLLTQAFSEDKFNRMMSSREKELNFYLEHGEMMSSK